MSTSWSPPPPKPEAHKKPRKKSAPATNGQVPKKPAKKARKTKADATDPRIPARLRNKVAIVGFAPHNTLTPFNDDTWEIWGINRLHVVRPGRYERWFELHDLADYTAEDGHLAWLKGFGGELFIRPMDVGLYDLPDAKPFPLDSLLAEFDPYFTNTISYLVALAILMGYEEIGLWGVDMAQDHLTQMEFGEQRPSVEYFLGIAKGRGIRITIPEGADLLVTGYLYGFGEPSPLRGKLEYRFQELGSRKEVARGEIAKLEAQKVGIVAQMNQLDGAMQDVAYLLRNLLPAISKEREYK